MNITRMIHQLLLMKSKKNKVNVIELKTYKEFKCYKSYKLKINEETYDFNIQIELLDFLMSGDDNNGINRQTKKKDNC